MAKLYACDLVEQAEKIDIPVWNSVCRAEANPFLAPAFLRTVENSFAGEASFWYAVFRNDVGQPVACACFSRYLVDGALMAPAGIQRAVAQVRRFWPAFLKYKILLGGLPVSTCGHQLAVSAGADWERLAASLDSVADDLARRTGCKLISFKEFDPATSVRLGGLHGHQFLKARSVTAYSLDGEFGAFDSYYDSRSKRTRANIRKHFRKFESAGLTIEHLRGRDGVDRLFDEEVHRLYLNVLDRAEVRFERVPAEFFRELARQLPDESCFTIARKGERIVGFCCAIASPQAYNMLFCGLDYSLNAEADLYFNLIYRGLAQGLVPGVRVVHIGASADQFKQHMGCRGESLSIYVRAVGAFQQLIFRQVFGLLFDTSEVADSIPMGEALAHEASDDRDLASPSRTAA